MEWLPGRVRFAVYHGHHFAAPPGADLIETWIHQSSAVSTPGSETFRFNLWLHQGLPPFGGLGGEVVVTHFAFSDLLIFADGFESGDPGSWSSTTVAPLVALCNH